MTADQQARRRELDVKLRALLEEYRDALAPEVEMPILGDWVLLAAIDDLSDRQSGTIAWASPSHQWVYRTLGLLHVGVETLRTFQSGS